MKDQHKNSSHQLRYLSPTQVVLDFPFVHTTGKQLLVGYPYLYVEGRHTMPVRLLEVSDTDSEVQLRLQNINTNEVFDVDWNMEYAGDYVLWEIYDLTTIMQKTKESEGGISPIWN